MNVLPLIFMALINAYRRRIKRVNSQPLNEHKTQCGAETKLWGRHKSKYKPQSLRSIFRFPLFPCHEIKPGNNETQSGSQTISDQGIGHPQTENPKPPREPSLNHHPRHPEPHFRPPSFEPTLAI